MRLETAFEIGEFVHMDAQTDIKGTVTAICFTTPTTYTVKVSWWHNGDLKAEWFDPYRLTLTED